jgi:amino acid transporter
MVLKRDSLGISAVFFCIATAAAPMTALLFNVPVIVSGAGWAVPAAFIVALVMLLVFTVGYVEMTRRVTSAGGFYSFVSHGFGQTLGLGTASVITFSHTILTASIVGIFAYFAKTTISDWTGINVPLIVLLLGPVAVCLLFAYFDIRITARVLGVFFVAEVTAALVFSIAVLVQGGANGLTAAPLNPLTAQGVQAQFSGKTISAFYPLTTHYVGASLTDAFRFLIMTSSFACTLAFFSTSSRYVFALGRERILPSALGRTHPTHKTPYVASAAVAAAIAIWILLFYASDSSTSAALLKLATWTPIVGVFGLLLVQALTSFAIVRYFRVVAPEHAHPVKTLIAPVLGGVLMVFSAWLLFHNRGALSGASGATFIRYGFWLVPITFVLGIGAAIWFRARDAARYAAVGRFVHEEA